MKMKDIPLDKWVQYAVTLLAVVAFAVLLFVLTFQRIPPGNENALNLALGALIGYVGNVINYYYGSSKGGRENREQLNQTMDKLIEKTKDNNNP